MEAGTNVRENMAEEGGRAVTDVPAVSVASTAPHPLDPDHPGMDGVRTRLIDILQQGFAQIESLQGNGGESQEMQDDWAQHKRDVEEFFRNARPDDPRFREKLSEMTRAFATGKAHGDGAFKADEAHGGGPDARA